jgi:Cu+-exporting ATPase
MLGAAAMSMSSVFVVTNALRLRLFQPSHAPVVQVQPAAEKVVYENAPTTVIGVDGMMCGHCTAAVEKACKAVPGVLAASADLEKKQVTVRGEAALDALEKAIAEAGYSIRK